MYRLPALFPQAQWSVNAQGNIVFQCETQEVATETEARFIRLIATFDAFYPLDGVKKIIFLAGDEVVASLDPNDYLELKSTVEEVLEGYKLVKEDGFLEVESDENISHLFWILAGLPTKHLQSFLEQHDCEGIGVGACAVRLKESNEVHEYVFNELADENLIFPRC